MDLVAKVGKTKEKARAKLAVRIKGKGNLPSSRNLVNAEIGYSMAFAKTTNKELAVTTISQIAKAPDKLVAKQKLRPRARPKLRQRERNDQEGDLLALLPR